MTKPYPAYFDPIIPEAHEIAGTAAYSAVETPFDVRKDQQMAFRVNWKASFDFPYMGMFIPPVANDTAQWTRYGGGMTSVEAMRAYSAGMKWQGFHVLSYFNVTEFGAEVTDPAPPRKATNDEDLWKNADDFLYATLADADPAPSGGRNAGDASVVSTVEIRRPILYLGERYHHGSGRAGPIKHSFSTRQRNISP